MSTRGKRLTNEEFVSRSNEKHNNKFDYSLVSYKNTHTKVKIICPTHGIFEQLPMDHLKGVGCGLCSGAGVALSSDVVIDRIKQTLGSRYDYSKVQYVNRNTKVTIICPEHGEFLITPHAIITQRQGCKKCNIQRAAQNRCNSTEFFVNKAAHVHNNKYDYRLVTYTNSNTKVNIICPKHGIFSQLPTNHVDSKQGCPECKKENAKGGIGGYTFESFENHPDLKDKPAILYVAYITNRNEKFWKIGITAKSTHHRFNRSEYKDMKVEVLREKQMSLFEAFSLEQQLLEELKPFKFFSNTQFSGYTECLRIVPEVVDRVNDVFKLTC